VGQEAHLKKIRIFITGGKEDGRTWANINWLGLPLIQSVSSALPICEAKIIVIVRAKWDSVRDWKTYEEVVCQSRGKLRDAG
jgi:hypothetical protein